MLICAIALFAFLWAAPYSRAPVHKSVTHRAVAVEVEGEVARPGIYMLDSSSATVSGAAARAGLRLKIPRAEAKRRLISGQSLRIIQTRTGVGIRLGRMPGAALLDCGLKLDLNAAPLGDLLLVPHLRPGIAEAIVQRRSREPWAKVDDLIEIRGVGPKTLETLRRYLEVSGRPRQVKRQK